MTRPIVLITRPGGAHAGLAQALEERGYQAVSNPLLDIVPTGAELPVGPFDAILFTSAASVRFVQDGADRHTPALTVGERTRQVAQDHGYAATCIGQTVEEAACWLLSSFTPAQTVLYPSGVHTAADLPSLLGAGGPVVTRVPVYATCPLPLEKATIDLLYARRIAWILLFSGRTAEALGLAMDGLLDQDWTLGTGLACLSAQVAAPVSHYVWRSLLIAPEPTEASLVAALPGSLGGPAQEAPL